MAEVLHYGPSVTKFERRSRYFVPFRTNTLGKGSATLYSPICRLNYIAVIFLQV